MNRLNNLEQLDQVIAQKMLEEKINLTIVEAIFVSSCLVKANKGNLFISVVLVKAVVEGITVAPWQER